MKVIVHKTTRDAGRMCASEACVLLNNAIAQNGEARLLVSTGASQFALFDSLVCQPVDWPHVTMFHLDEYCGLSQHHPASFRLYLKQRFIDRLPVPLKRAVWVTGEDTPEALAQLAAEVTAAPMDLGLIGIGENAHIAFNDPPADFETTSPYIVVTLDEACRKQQHGEGWFPTLEDVPARAVSMSVRQILACKTIFSLVPHVAKARAVYCALQAEVTPEIPATILKTHPDWTLHLDEESAAMAEQHGLIAR